MNSDRQSSDVIKYTDNLIRSAVQRIQHFNFSLYTFRFKFQVYQTCPKSIEQQLMSFFFLLFFLNILDNVKQQI